MKLKSYLFAAITTVGICLGSTAQAGFYVKKQAAAVHYTLPATANNVETAAMADVTGNTAQMPVAEHKKGFWNRAADFLLKRAKLDIAVYIILCILPLGWLAIGLNDDFEGSRWLISLLLYIIGYIPGLIYSLIMMGKYY